MQKDSLLGLEDMRKKIGNNFLIKKYYEKNSSSMKSYFNERN